MVPMLPATVTATAVARYVNGYSIYSVRMAIGLLTAQPGAGPGPALQPDPQASQVTEHRQQPRQVTLGLAAQVPPSPAVRTVHITVVGAMLKSRTVFIRTKCGVRLTDCDVPEARHAGARGLACCRVRKRWGLYAPVGSFVRHVDVSSRARHVDVGSRARYVDVGSFVYHVDVGSTVINGGAYSIHGCVVLPLTNTGKCYAPGQYCRNSDRDKSGVAGNGEKIVCKNQNGWRWELA